MATEVKDNEMRKINRNLQPAGHKSIKKIQKDHFPILLDKLEPFKDSLNYIDAFVAGLCAAHDYSCITMILRKICEKREEE